MLSSAAAFAAFLALASTARAQDQLVYDDTDPGIDYEPAGEWALFPSAANLDAYNGTFHFTALSGNTSDPGSGVAQATATWTFPVAASGFAWYGFQRSDAGLYTICFDCDGSNPQSATVDALNTSSTGNDPPVVLYSTQLDMGIHTVKISNQFDDRHGTYGQITIDAFVLSGVSASASGNTALVAGTTSSTSSSTSSSSSTSTTSTSTSSSTSSSTTSTIPASQSFPSASPSTTSHSVPAGNIPSSSPSATPASGAMRGIVPGAGLLIGAVAAVFALL